MRRLHAVGIREKFVASGVYVTATSREQWTIHSLGEGARLVRVDEQFADHFALHEALIEPNALFARYTQEAFFAGEPRHKHNFILEHDSLLHTESRGGDTDEESLEVPEQVVLICPTWILQGLAWYSLQNHSFRGYFDVTSKQWHPSLVFIANDETLRLNNKHYTITKLQLNSLALWLDPHGIALKIEDDGTDYDLTQFALAR